MRITEEDRVKIHDALVYLADSMIAINNMAKMHTCNDCGIARKCAYAPEVGSSVRYNCPLWQERKTNGVIEDEDI